MSLPAAENAPATPVRSAGPAAPHRLAETMENALPGRPTSVRVIGGLVRLSDLFVVWLAGLAVRLTYLRDLTDVDVEYGLLIGTVGLATVFAYQLLELYDVSALRNLAQRGVRVMGGWTLVFLLAFMTIFFLKLEGTFSRIFFASWFLIGLFGLLAARMLVSVLVRRLTRLGRLDRRIAVVGAGEAGERLVRELDASPDNDLRICGVFDDRQDSRSPDLVGGFPKLGTVDDLVVYARHARLDLVIFAMPVTAEERILKMLRKINVLPVDIRLAAHTQKLKFRPRNYSYVGRTPMFDVADKPIADWDTVFKWLFDKLVGSLLLLLLSPVMLATALAVRLDSRGPALFRQKRYGFNNELIEVFKFRSMYVEQSDATAARLVTRGDPRVTRVGRFIRKTSLDELPQLFNVVFRGNLSLVGPRPHAVNAKAENRLYDDVVDGYFARHKVKPGITGWAQINGWRGETDTREKIEKRVEYDLHYIENWSVLYDLYILAMTPFALARSENAY